MLLSIRNAPRDYAWGSTTLIADLQGRTPSGAAEAEIWFGDHPGDPADLATGGTLAEVTGGRLPYLLKLLAAAEPLSIQVHPTREQARAGWAREQSLAPDDPTRNYRDDNHKPELIVALSDQFEALSGLRPVSETLTLLDALGASRGVEALRARLRGGGDVLADTIAWLLSGQAQDAVDDVIAAVRTAASDSGALAAVARIAERYPRDAGVVVALLMNYIVLRRGEGVFLRAGLVHAYLAGLGVEIMAASDNVLRGGLTPKRVDVAELLRVLDTSTEPVPILRPDQDAAFWRYDVDIDDFALTRITLRGDQHVLPIAGPTMVLATGGNISVTSASGEQLAVAVGEAAFVGQPESRVTIHGTGEVFVATAGDGERHAEGSN